MRQLAAQAGWYRDMYRYQQLEAALDDAPEMRGGRRCVVLANCGRLLKRLLAYGSPWRKPLGIAVADDVGCGGGGSQRAAAYQLFYRQYGGEKLTCR